MIIYGDSNSRAFYHSIRTRTTCFETLVASKSNWHAPKTCTNKQNNFTVQFISHSSPFHSGTISFSNYSWLQSPNKLFDSIPSNGRYIISFNHYLHFTSHHISVYEHALVPVRDAVRRLLNRNSDVRVLLRAPHVAELPPLTFVRGDNLAEQFHTIQREIFKDLEDRLIYFPTWDMTVAAQDTRPHPIINDHISHVMLQFLCGREK